MSWEQQNQGDFLTGSMGMSVADAIARRVSCRSYKPDPLPQALILRILEAARLAPSACNQQPWRFAIVRDPGLRRRIAEEGFLPGIKMTWAIAAPVHVVVGMETSFLTHRLAASASGVNYPWVDIGIAGENWYGCHGVGPGHLLDWMDQAAGYRPDRGLVTVGKTSGSYYGRVCQREGECISSGLPA